MAETPSLPPSLGRLVSPSPSASSAISSSFPLPPDASISSSSATGGKAASSLAAAGVFFFFRRAFLSFSWDTGHRGQGQGRASAVSLETPCDQGQLARPRGSEGHCAQTCHGYFYPGLLPVSSLSENGLSLEVPTPPGHSRDPAPWGPLAVPSVGEVMNKCPWIPVDGLPEKQTTDAACQGLGTGRMRTSPSGQAAANGLKGIKWRPREGRCGRSAGPGDI